MLLPDDPKKLKNKAIQLVEQCRVSAGRRADMARSLKRWRFTGSDTGIPAIYNRLNVHLNRLGAYLFSPADLTFYMEFENTYDKNITRMGDLAARKLTRRVEAEDLDKKFALGVDTALTYGSSIMRLSWELDKAPRDSSKKTILSGKPTGRIISPYNFGVYREDLDELDSQEAVCETGAITLSDLWRKLQGRSDREDLIKRARSYAKKRTTGEEADSYFHQVILAAPQPVMTSPSPMVAGFVNVLTGAGDVTISPSILAETVLLHTLFVWNDITNDYTTIQLAEPDIIILPHLIRENVFLPGELPYIKIQPNSIENNFWGRSELIDLILLQTYLNERMIDVKNLMSRQFDKLLAFIGGSEVSQEVYDGFKNSGFISQSEPTFKIEDLTPPLPDKALDVIEMVKRAMDEVSGFQNILAGQGEQGVRAGSHAQTLVRTASPPLRDRALQVERQCAEMGDKIFNLMAAKDPDLQIVGEEELGNQEVLSFFLSQLPADHRIVVDSHSSSPIYEQDHMQTAAFLAKLQAIDKESIVDMVNVPRKDLIKQKVREMIQQEQEMRKQILEHHPNLLFSSKGKG